MYVADVHESMRLQVISSIESLPAHLARVRLTSGVNAHVLLQVGLQAEHVTTNRARVRILGTCNKNVAV